MIVIFQTSKYMTKASMTVTGHMKQIITVVCMRLMKYAYECYCGYIHVYDDNVDTDSWIMIDMLMIKDMTRMMVTSEDENDGNDEKDG